MMMVFYQRITKRQQRSALALTLCLLTFVMMVYFLTQIFEMLNDPSIKSTSIDNPGVVKENVNYFSDLQGKIDSQRLFYNRLPRTGESILVRLMKQLADQHGYKYTAITAMPRNNASFLSTRQQRELVSHISQEAITPCTFDIMTPFVDFTKYGELLPIYFGMIRDPVETFISSYSVFVSARITEDLSGNTEKSLKVNPQTYLNYWSLEECIMDKEPRCTPEDGKYNPISIVGHYCGDEYECWVQNSPRALQTALHNIDRAYKVLGVFEYMEETARVMEKVLPQFFTGIVEEYRKIDFGLGQDRWKVNVSEKAKEMLKNNLFGDYQLYKYLVMRLHTQDTKNNKQINTSDQSEDFEYF